MRIKNINIENFNPLVCVPIVDTTIEDSLSTAKTLVEDGATVIEWRLDYLKELSDIRALDNGLKEMAAVCNYTILVGTIRTIAEGGNCTFKADEMKQYLIHIAKSKTCDFIDMEYYTYDEPRSLITTLKNLGARVICSHHDFDETPEDDIALTLLEEMECSECDVVKMAVMPVTTTDVTRFMDVCNAFAMETNKLTITMSMGELGRVSRFAGNVTGSAVTFGSFNSQSAPGQIDYKKLQDIIRQG